MNTNEPRVKIEEVTSVLTAAPGVDIYDAIQDAQLAGYERIEINQETNTALITWFKKVEN